jgi:diaminopimelate epimerase
MSRSAAALLLMSLALGCGKYGPPVRAGAEQEPARKPSFEVPLPVIREPAAPEARRRSRGRGRASARGRREPEAPFTKMQGAGNDFVVLDGIAERLPALERLAQRLGDRHFGIGFDQLLVVRPSSTADFRMEIYNADGSQVEMCANGIRCFFQYLREAGHTRQGELRVETLSGVVVPRWAGPGRVTVDMGPPVLAPAKIPTRLGDPAGAGPVLDARLELDGRPLSVNSVSMGNPHCVVYVEDVDAAPVEVLGPKLERHHAFPNRVNVEFVQVVGRAHLRQRTWERGTGETLACGSGACASVVVSILRGVTDARVRVELRGGDLDIHWAGGTASVFMTGPAATVFTGTIELEGS